MILLLQDGKNHDVTIEDDGTLDTVIVVDGQMVGRYDMDSINERHYRRLDGTLTTQALIDLGSEVLYDHEEGF